MRIVRTAFLCLAALSAAAPAFGGDLFEQPRTPAQEQAVLRKAMPDLEQVQVLRGTFVQRKFLREIPRPLASNGEFLLVRGQGVWWHTLAPLDSELTLTAAGLVQQDLGAKARTRSSAEQPGLEVAASMFFALFALDLDTLARSFDLFGMESGTHWLLGLRPRDAAMAAWFRQATIGGAGRVEQVTLYEGTGDRTEIDLTATVQPPSSLTPAERARFGR